MTLDELLLEWSYRSEKGDPALDSPSDVSILKQILEKLNIPSTEIISNIKTNIGGQKRLDIAKSHLREIRRNFRRLNNKVYKLEEQLKILEEERSK